ncbi:hypothetical protein EKK58_05180 [Candidatus Dependentiae bacterium]|nr:MAG: hypothetical protein EKK58_05180 [Candidatus Dependentiae bacterium]
MASTHELMQLEELTTAAIVLARMDLGDPEARVVSHWTPTKYFVGKLPEVIRVELRVGDRVIANSEAAVVPFADGDSRTAKDVEARQIAGRRTAITNVIQELCEREAERAPKVGSEAISDIVGSLGAGIILDEKKRTVTIPRDGLEEIFPDGMSPRVAQRVAMLRLGMPANLIDPVLDRANSSNGTTAKPVDSAVVRVCDLGMVFSDEVAAERIALLGEPVRGDAGKRIASVLRAHGHAVPTSSQDGEAQPIVESDPCR